MAGVIPIRSPHGACRIYDAAGRLVEEVDPATRERRRDGQVVGTLAWPWEPRRETVNCVWAHNKSIGKKGA